ncbi:MAG: peptide-methionine (S)-S-oxide reductase MsrA [Spirochaetales bacterium]|uniref:Peptide methionine sulfoxide reductase MsrA n=1 Tax=Candidatus Thalassospirochaeta sargassi TaxID=3119039 RepID=A0AAJ1IA52_9SPIO|nr:peptide-methionine (S)-S-oxide reductase MsrA [Spirochaetales bacterium]
MNKKFFTLIITFAVIGGWISAQGNIDSGDSTVPALTQEELKIRGPLPDWRNSYSDTQVSSAVFAGGCFWGVEAVFEQIDGVLNVESGYSGGDADTASYKMVGTGTTGHAEAVEIIYDPEIISYRKLLDVFFRFAHDPTQLNYQGPDHGSEYRSAVFFSNSEEKQIIEEMIEKLNKEKIYKQKIVTEITPLQAFYPAEDYHQDFLRLNPSYPYIVYWDIPKLIELQRVYPELIAEE